MAVSGIPEMSVSGTIPEVRLKVDMIQYGGLLEIVLFAIKVTFAGYQFMTDFYSQNLCVCSTRSHGPLLCAFCISFHFKYTAQGSIKLS